MNRNRVHRDHILLIAGNFPPVRGGSALVYRELAHHAHGRIHVLAASRNYEDMLPLIGWREFDRLAGYPIKRMPLLRTPLTAEPPRATGRLRLALLELWIRAQIMTRVIHLLSHEPIGAVCIGELVTGGWLLKFLKPWWTGRRVVYVHGEEITTNDDYDPHGHRRRASLKAADGVIAVSRFTAEATATLLRDTTPCPPISLIGNGVDFRRFNNATLRPDLIARYDLAHRFVYISVCRLLEKKGIDKAIRAFAQLYRDAPNCRFLVVGTGPFAPELAAIAAGEGVADSVIFTGDVPDDDLPDHYRLGDVFVMPNRKLASGDTEGFGLVFLEANAAGLPVIAGAAGGSQDAVTNEANGLVVDGTSVEAIASAMRRLHYDASLRARLIASGLERAANEDWAEKTRQFLAICLGSERWNSDRAAQDAHSPRAALRSL